MRVAMELVQAKGDLDEAKKRISAFEDETARLRSGLERAQTEWRDNVQKREAKVEEARRMLYALRSTVDAFERVEVELAEIRGDATTALSQLSSALNGDKRNTIAPAVTLLVESQMPPPMKVMPTTANPPADIAAAAAHADAKQADTKQAEATGTDDGKVAEAKADDAQTKNSEPALRISIRPSAFPPKEESGILEPKKANGATETTEVLAELWAE
jgi:hypothetical protein